MKDVTDEQIYEKLNAAQTAGLERTARRLHIGAIPYRKNNRKDDLVDALWFSMDDEFPRHVLVKILFGRTKRSRKKIHILKKHAIRIKYKLAHMHKRRKEKRRARLHDRVKILKLKPKEAANNVNKKTAKRKTRQRPKKLRARFNHRQKSHAARQKRRK